MNTPGKRLKYVIKSLNLTQNEVADRFGINRSLLSQLYTDKQQISKLFQYALKAEFNINPAWLLTGEGEMFTSPPSPLSPERGGETPKVMQSDAKKNGHLAGHDGNVEEYPGITEPEQIYRTGWWKKLDSAGKYIEAVVPELTPDARKRIKAMIEYELRAQEEIEKELAEEAKYKYQKGEAG